jgi:NAD(P)-dependent dehydrogenase (short-subunit alcohol dehydrogenase family)
MKTKTYVITGAASGIGRSLIMRLADSNIVYAGCRNKAHEAELRGISDNIYPFYIDYALPETIEKAGDYILSECKKIDTVVNIAGCVVAGPVENLNMNEVRRQFNVNVFGHLELTQKLMPAIENGKIINVSSMASFGIFPFISPYCASKRCLDMFFNSLLIENKKNIKVVSIKPGVIATPLWGKSIDENSKYFDNYGEYSQEMQYVIANARKNSTKGLSAEKVVDVILKADRLKNPKLSYTVGRDAFMANLISKLPQGVINSLVKTGIRLKMKNAK